MRLQDKVAIITGGSKWNWFCCMLFVLQKKVLKCYYADFDAHAGAEQEAVH